MITIKLTPQEALNQVYKAMIEQGGPSYICDDRTTDKKCQYRGDEGRKCAFGCLINDEDYSPSLEGQSVWSLTTQEYKVRFEHEKTYELCRSMQYAHDGYFTDGQLSGDSWSDYIIRSFTYIANKFGLELPK